MTEKKIGYHLLDTALQSKIDAETVYTAGENIQISGENVISATDTNTKYTAGEGLTLTNTTFKANVQSVNNKTGKIVLGGSDLLIESGDWGGVSVTEAVNDNASKYGLLNNLIGNMYSLTTANKSHIIGAINEVNAKTFPDTTYEEITEDEINTGTSSESRAISARRLKFAVDKGPSNGFTWAQLKGGI